MTEQYPSPAAQTPSTEPAWALNGDPAPRDPAVAAPATDAPTEQQQAGEPYPWFWDSPRQGIQTAEPRRHVWRAGLAWFIAAMLGAGVGGGAVYLRLGDRTAGEVRVVKPPVVNGSALPVNAPAQVAQAVLPSIVQIQVAGLQGSGVGSGVVYSSDGYIITNNHVIAGADQIEVNLPTGETLSGALIGTAAPAVDIAVIKVVPKQPLTPATFGNTSSLHVGDLAVAVGSPFGLDATVTAGIISALHRNRAVDADVRFTDAIQTDAPINPGNSGGALADASGEVIGINTAIIGGNGGNVGVGFAIPIDIARKVTEQIIKTGKAQLAFLGISGDNLPQGKGAHVSSVGPGGPADRAGIKPEDVIVSLDGTAVTSMDQLIELLLQRNVGDKVRVVVDRNGKRLTLTATLTARPTG